MFCDIDDIDTDLCWSSITCVIDTATEAPTTAPTASALLDGATGTTGSDGGGTGGIDAGTELGPTAEPTASPTSPHLGDPYDIELFAMVSHILSVLNLSQVRPPTTHEILHEMAPPFLADLGLPMRGGPRFWATG